MSDATARPYAFRLERSELWWIAGAIAIAPVIALLPPRTALALVACAVIALISMWRPSAGVGVLVATVPVQAAWPAMMGGHAVTWTRLSVLALLVGWITRLLIGRGRLFITPLGWAQIAFAGVLVASIWNARDLAAWGEEIYRWLVATLIFVIAVNVIEDDRDRWNVILGIVSGIVFSAGVAAYQVWTDTGPATFNNRGVIRAYGLFGEPNPFAGYLAMSTLPLIAVAIATWRSLRLVSIAIFAVAAIGSITLLLTQSRGGLLGFGAGLAVIVWMSWPRAGRRLVIAGVVVAALVVVSPAGSSIRATFGIENLLAGGPAEVTPATFSAQERLAHWGAATEMWRSHPIIGIGAGNFPNRYREFTPEWRFRISRGHAHSAYLQAAAQAGVVGLVAYLLLLATAVKRMRRRIGTNVLERGLCTGALAVTAALAVHGVFEYLHVLSLGISLSVAWAMADSQPAVAGD